MSHAETVCSLVGRIHAAGGAEFVEETPGCGVHSWWTRLGRWPFEMQVDRYAREVRCYLADELLCTGRISEDEANSLAWPPAGGPDPGAAAAALKELAGFVDGVVRTDTRRFLAPPHADRHPDRRADPRMESTIVPKAPRKVDTPG
jgi:hypothetical protein